MAAAAWARRFCQGPGRPPAGRTCQWARLFTAGDRRDSDNRVGFPKFKVMILVVPIRRRCSGPAALRLARATRRAGPGIQVDRGTRRALRPGLSHGASGPAATAAECKGPLPGARLGPRAGPGMDSELRPGLRGSGRRGNRDRAAGMTNPA